MQVETSSVFKGKLPLSFKISDVYLPPQPRQKKSYAFFPMTPNTRLLELTR